MLSAEAGQYRSKIVQRWGMSLSYLLPFHRSAAGGDGGQIPSRGHVVVVQFPHRIQPVDELRVVVPHPRGHPVGVVVDFDVNFFFRHEILLRRLPHRLALVDPQFDAAIHGKQV